MYDPITGTTTYEGVELDQAFTLDYTATAEQIQPGWVLRAPFTYGRVRIEYVATGYEATGHRLVVVAGRFTTDTTGAVDKPIAFTFSEGDKITVERPLRLEDLPKGYRVKAMRDRETLGVLLSPGDEFAGAWYAVEKWSEPNWLRIANSSSVSMAVSAAIYDEGDGE